MAMAILEKNTIFYRFASEPNVVEKIEFTGRQIAVGDLKQAIADLKKLNRFDLALVNEATNEVYAKDGCLLQRNMSVTVKRTPPQTSRKASVVHVENSDVWATMTKPKEAVQEAIQTPSVRRPLPPEYLCPLCRDLYEDPVISRCCGRSACSRCFRGTAKGVCPLCRAKRNGTNVELIPNKSLAESVASLDLDFFVLPREIRAVEAVKNTEVAAAGGVLAATEVLLPGLTPGALLPPSSPSPTMGLPPSSPVGDSPHGPLPAADGGVVRRCMLLPEQFLAWQGSMDDDESYSSSSSSSSTSSSSEGRPRKKRK